LHGDARVFGPDIYADAIPKSRLRPVQAPICFTALAAQEVLPYYELRTNLAMQGKNSDEIAEALQAVYTRGELPKRSAVSFAYMYLLTGQSRPHR
jgi:hypothetical protein